MKDLMKTLKTLDPAQEITMTDARRLRATETLERVLATPTDRPAGTADRPGRRPAGRRPVFRPAVALPALAALAAVVVAVQTTSGDAYESWTPVAVAVTPEDLTVATQACRAELGPELAGGVELLSERRGDFVTVFVQKDEPNLTGECRVKLPEGSSRATVDATSVGGGSGPAPQVAARAVSTVTSTEGGPSSSVVGVVGSDVRGLTVRSGDVTVQATLKGGRFVAWWPGEMDVPPAYDITLEDGRVIRDVADGGLYARR